MEYFHNLWISSTAHTAEQLCGNLGGGFTAAAVVRLVWSLRFESFP
jgi:hypothetical protein